MTIDLHNISDSDLQLILLEGVVLLLEDADQKLDEYGEPADSPIRKKIKEFCYHVRKEKRARS